MQYHVNSAFDQLICSIGDSLAASQYHQAEESVLTLQDMAAALEDQTALEAAHIYSGILQFHRGNLDRSLALQKRALSIGLSHDSPTAPYFNMLAYCALADVCNKKSEFYSGLGNCLNAYHIASAHPEYRYESILLHKIGNTFLWLDEYEMALGYLTTAYDMYIELGMNDRPLLTSIILSAVDAYSCAGEYAMAEQWALGKPMDWTEDEQSALECILLANEARKCSEAREDRATAAALERFLDRSKHVDAFLLLFRSYINVGRVSILRGKRELAARVMERLETLEHQSALETFRYRFAELRVQYYRQFIRSDTTLSPADEYYDPYYWQSLRTIDQLKGNYLSSLLLELEVDKLKFSNNSVLRRSFQLEKDLELDPLTGLLNRTSAEKYVTQRMSARLEGAPQAMLLINISDFKNLNDLYGHHFGDMLLLEVSDILNECVASDSVVSRFGGSEFLIFFSHARSEGHIRSLMLQITESGAQIPLPDSQVDKVCLQVGGALIDRSMPFTEALALARARLA